MFPSKKSSGFTFGVLFVFSLFLLVLVQMASAKRVSAPDALDSATNKINNEIGRINRVGRKLTHEEAERVEKLTQASDLLEQVAQYIQAAELEISDELSTAQILEKIKSACAVEGHSLLTEAASLV